MKINLEPLGITQGDFELETDRVYIWLKGSFDKYSYFARFNNEADARLSLHSKSMLEALIAHYWDIKEIQMSESHVLLKLIENATGREWAWVKEHCVEDE